MRKTFSRVLSALVVALVLLGMASPPSQAAPSKKATKASKSAAKKSKAKTTKRKVPSAPAKAARPTTTVSEAARTGARFGGSATFLVPLDLASQTMDPARLSNTIAGSDGTKAYAIYDQLVKEDPRSGKILLGTASSLTSSADAQVWTLKVRPGIKFTDGTAYDAAAVKYNWDRILDPGTRANAALISTIRDNIRKLTVQDPLTLVITLQRPIGQWPRFIASTMSLIGSPTALKASPEQFTASPVGAGPFMVKTYRPNDVLEMVRNPTYWNAPLPYLDRIVFRPITDEAQRYNTLKSGAGDAMFSVQTVQLAQAKRDRISVVTTPSNGGRYVLFNMKRAPFTDIRAREAVSLALDRNLYADYEPGATVATSVFEKSFEMYSPGQEFPPGNAARAQQLFDQIAAETGRQLSITMISTPGTSDEMQFFQAQLLGFRNVRVTFSTLTVAAYSDATQRGEFDLAPASTNFIDPSPGLNAFLSVDAANVSGYYNPSVNAALRLGASSLNVDERRSAYRTVTAAINKDFAAYYYKRTESWIYNGGDLAGIDTIAIGSLLVDRVWLKA